MTLCSHFGVCGGCSSQNLPYEIQCQQKEEYVSNLFGKKAEPIIRCDSPYQYRNKMEFSFSQSKEGEKFLGLMQKGRQRVVQLQECLLTPSWFIECLSNVYRWWCSTTLMAYFPPANRGTLRTLTMREGKRTEERMVLLTISGEIEESLVLDFAAMIGANVDTVILRRQFTAKKMETYFEERVLKGNGYIHEEIDNFRFKIRPASFFQPNTAQAEKLYRKVLEEVEGEIVFDLFCGIGTIGILTSPNANQVIGIEIVPDAVHDGEDNLQMNNVTNMKIHHGDVGEVLKSMPDQPDTIIIDPPRAGLGKKTIELLKTLNPKKLIYVSCNPKTQVLDCKELGLTISKIQPVDQFPHTSHIENIVVLTSS